jgi:hypothetical protein
MAVADGTAVGGRIVAVAEGAEVADGAGRVAVGRVGVAGLGAGTWQPANTDRMKSIVKKRRMAVL